MMSLQAIMRRVGVMERRRLRRWIGYVIILWLGLWGIYWLWGMGHQPAGTPLEEQAEVIEAFAEIYPIGL